MYHGKECSPRLRRHDSDFCCSTIICRWWIKHVEPHFLQPKVSTRCISLWTSARCCSAACLSRCCRSCSTCQALASKITAKGIKGLDVARPQLQKMLMQAKLIAGSLYHAESIYGHIPIFSALSPNKECGHCSWGRLNGMVSFLSSESIET